MDGKGNIQPPSLAGKCGIFRDFPAISRFICKTGTMYEIHFASGIGRADLISDKSDCR